MVFSIEMIFIGVLGFWLVYLVGTLFFLFVLADIVEWIIEIITKEKKMSDSISKVMEDKEDAHFYFQNRKNFSFEKQLKLYKEYGKYLTQKEDNKWFQELSSSIKGKTE